jgi:hypothetical protein
VSGRRAEREARVLADIRALAAEKGVELLAMGDLVPADTPGLRCANGYNLNEEGSRRVGDRLADWILDGAPPRGYESRFPSSSGAVTGARQAKLSHT